MHALSTVKSAVSLDDQPSDTQRLSHFADHRQLITPARHPTNQHVTSPHNSTTDMQEIQSENSRLRRKITILQKTKEVLLEQLSLANEDIESKNRKIQKIESLDRGIHTSSQDSSFKRDYESQLNEMRIILSEKEEQIQMIVKQLQRYKKKAMEESQCNCHLSEEVQSKQRMIQRLRQSSSSQLNYQLSQISYLDNLLIAKQQQIQALKKHNSAIEVQSQTKWQGIIHQLKQQLKLAEGLIRERDHQINRKQERIRAIFNQNKQLKGCLEDQKQKVQWHKTLLEEAKGQFIHAQLMQQQRLDKQQRQKKDLNKRTKMLKQQLKCNKSQTQTNSASTNQRSIRLMTPITPFALEKNMLTCQQSTKSTT